VVGTKASGGQQRPVVDAKVKWWAVEANGGGHRHVVDAEAEW